MKVLRAKLLDLKRQQQEEELAEIKGDHIKAEWGSQIRSYVLHPYQMVKDHRTNFEVGNANGVLDGDLDGFIRAALATQRRMARAGFVCLLPGPELRCHLEADWFPAVHETRARVMLSDHEPAYPAADEAEPLRRIDDMHHLTSAYLVALCEQHLGSGQAALTQAAASHVLCRHIRATREQDPRSPARIASIRALARFPSAEGNEVLRELTSSKWLGFGANESRPIRRLAAQVLKETRPACSR